MLLQWRTRPAGSALRTPSHSSADASANQQRREAADELFTSRDRYRCVVSQMFCRPETHWRRRESGLLKIARDDEGNVIDIRQPGSECYDLEVAHTILWFWTPEKATKNWLVSHYFWHACFVDILILSRMIPKELQLRMLHMFDTDISAIIDGVEIDTPQNALSLAQSISPTFYAFTIYLNEIKDRNNIYQISNHDKTISDANKLPREANFNNSNHSNINPPSHHLLTIHRAISKILHLSTAGEYINEIFKDKREYVQSNGSTNLNEILSLKL